MKTSRQKLLEYVQMHRSVTVGDLSRALKMTPANARHHLSILAQQGLVAVVGQRPPDGKGRPAALYSLSEQALGNNLDGLAGALLAELAQRLPPEGREAAFRSAARRLAGNGATARPGALAPRLVAAVKRLNEMNYAARWEAHAQGPRLILGRCPYAAVLEEHPELCRLDNLLMEELVGQPTVHAARLALDAQRRPYCMFVVGKSKP